MRLLPDHLGIDGLAGLMQTADDLSLVKITPANFHELSPLISWWESKPVDFAKTKLAPKVAKLPVTAAKTVGRFAAICAPIIVSSCRSYRSITSLTN